MGYGVDDLLLVRLVCLIRMGFCGYVFCLRYDDASFEGVFWVAPDLLRRLIPQALMRRYSGICYDARDPCPRCGSERIVGFGWLERTFCIVIAEGGFRDVVVRV